MEVKLAKEGTPMARFQKERTKALSDMFDNLNEHGIFPTSTFFARIDAAAQAFALDVVIAAFKKE